MSVVFLLVPSYKLWFFTDPDKPLLGLSPLCCSSLLLGPRLEAQTATTPEPCFLLSCLSWEEGVSLGGRVYLVSLMSLHPSYLLVMGLGFRFPLVSMTEPTTPAKAKEVPKKKKKPYGKKSE